MNDVWGLVAGVTTLIVLRVLDYFLPKGWHFKNLDRYAEKSDSDTVTEEEQESQDK